MAILFYSARQAPYGCFSNFSAHSFFLDGRRWKTSEHYFQAQKFVGTAHELEIWRAKGPGEAARMGRDRKRPLRRDWESVKDNVMRRVVRAKFEANEDIRQLLLGTKEAELIEDSPIDYYWGCGADGSGKNMLGRILMELRAELRAKEQSQASEGR